MYHSLAYFCIVIGKKSEEQVSYPFHFRGCGWKPKEMAWDSSDFEWIKIMVFGEDFLQYDYDKKKVCHFIDDCKPKFVYVREDWNEEYSHMIVLDDLAPPDDFSMCTGEEGESCVWLFVKNDMSRAVT